MSLESDLHAALSAVCSQVFPDFAPFGTVAPYITWQQVGGVAPSYVESTIPDHRNGRIQVNVWSATRAQVNAMALQVEAALMQNAVLQARPVGALIATSDAELTLRGTIQDFTIWAAR